MQGKEMEAGADRYRNGYRPVILHGREHVEVTPIHETTAIDTSSRDGRGVLRPRKNGTFAKVDDAVAYSQRVVHARMKWRQKKNEPAESQQEPVFRVISGP